MKLLLLLLTLTTTSIYAQNKGVLSGRITTEGDPLAFANVYIQNTSKGSTTDENGYFKIEHIDYGSYYILASFTGFKSKKQRITISKQETIVNFNLDESESLDEIVISGTLKPVRRSDSPVPVEVYSTAFLKKNPTPSIFEAMQNVNGVRPQINCNVCNTGDIHINGLEGPYTLVLIDGMPIVSGLSTVYGLSGIPNSLINQIEIVKGPASSLYGSEAVGGLINIITKSPDKASSVFADAFVSSWGEVNADLSFKANISDKIALLLGINYFNYSNPIDNNNDNFTDLTLQDRVSIFQKWKVKRKNNRVFDVAGRFFYEDRWGGEMNWDKSYRGGDKIYGESIYTTRYELLGNYQLPVNENMFLQFSYTEHDQNSVYGDVPYLAQQRIGFTQLTWYKTLNKHDVLAGTAARYNYYNDNTPATVNADEVVIPSLFIQDNISFNTKHNLLLGARYDYDERHGSIFTPRLAYKYKSDNETIIRFNAGTGFRVVNLFTEEHAALTGARDVIIAEELKPEQSYNINFNYLETFYTKNHNIFTLDASAWYTYFTNVILPDYDSNPNEIIYDNLNGHAVTTGVSANADITFTNGLKVLIGATFQDVSQTEDGITTKQILTESYSGTWGVSYSFYKPHITLDYTGNLYGPMRLPLLGDLDPREEYSPVYSIQNIQATYAFSDFEIYGGVKNLLNWTPNKGNPFIIARTEDPFDKNVQFNNNGDVIPTADNPYALTFDPSYVYAPNQGIRLFLGMRYKFN
ncbi:TonB-dependent receptor [Formosa agariphila KMM 3901]|uniref:TonB-dependent receptor n=1 Tax=Formosa agariphila (strain DSM 15362 / KCTC 12365 / LMG 23005 / KMM 3901 / M-2Alg 35-1) TaxID=1347342 RepID=T2KHC8_FORAG|nr:TonB-dependent receptor [Formosa agariphila]CDF77796.1 TonB-dependent receptor [Formosa agariphila KMM 3901]